MEVLETEEPPPAVEVANKPAPVEGDVKSKGDEPDVQAVKKTRDDKSRRKDEKSVEQVVKALNSLGTSEEKLAAMCKKYSDIVEENRKLQLLVKQSEKKSQTLQREKDQLQSEQSKAVLTRSRLENLCRELQKQNKAIKDESLLKIREEEEKRKVVSGKFQTALGEITALMQQNNENYSKLKEENLEMQNKFKTLCEQYELREQQVEKMSKQMQLESQLADVKLAKVKIDMFAEKELLANEKEQLLMELTAYQNKCQEMQKTEAALRNQVTMYTEKYDEFQSALAKSNQIYAGFKMEIEKMSKKITKLEKETSTWKMKWEGSHKALLQMAAEKQQRDAELALATRQLTQLQKLCRTLQSERTSLINQLKNEGKTPTVDGGSEASTSVDKLTGDEVSQDVKDISDSSILDENIDIKDGESNCNGTSVEGQVEDKVEVQEESHVEENHIDKVIPDNMNSIITSAEDNESVVNQVTSNHELCKEVTSEGSQLKSGENDSSAGPAESRKKDQDSVKSQGVNEPKKGKEGSKKRKK